jgi:hypothetical protein
MFKLSNLTDDEYLKIVLDFQELCKIYYDRVKVKRNQTINTILDILDDSFSQQERFLNDYFDKIKLIKHPATKQLFLENGELKTFSMYVITSDFESYQDMCDFINEKLNNCHLFVYIYINPEDRFHRLRYGLIDKNYTLM